MAGAFVTTMLIYALAYQKGVSPVRMILSGMAVSALFGAFNDIIKTLFAESLGNASGFLVGGLNGCGWKQLPYDTCRTLLREWSICLFLPSKMNILMLGDETANSLGLQDGAFQIHSHRGIVAALRARQSRRSECSALSVSSSRISRALLVGLGLPVSLSRRRLFSGFR